MTMSLQKQPETIATEIPQAYKLWEQYYDLPDYKHILQLMHDSGFIQCDSEMLREMEKYDLDLMRNYVKWHNPVFQPIQIARSVRRKNGPIKITKWGPINIGLNYNSYKPEQQWDSGIILPRKKWYLKAYMEVVEEYFSTYKRIWEDLTLEDRSMHEKLIFHSWRLEKYYRPVMDWAVQNYAYFRPVFRDYQDLERSYKRVKGEYDFYGVKFKEGDITEAMVQQAKQYPFTGIIKFNRAGFSKCPYHNEKTPSFSYNRKDNYAHCFGCGKGVDTIQYVMDTMNKDFREAVMYLNGK